MNLKVRAEKSVEFGEILLFCFEQRQDGKVVIPNEPLKYKVVEQDDIRLSHYIEDAQTFTGIKVAEDAGQILLDDLYNMGFRPKNTIDRTETVESQKEHIKSLKDEISFLRIQLEKQNQQVEGLGV